MKDEAVEAAERVLIAHQRRDNSSCLCGWSELGKSHPGHQVEMLTAAGLLTSAPRQWGEGWRARYRSCMEKGCP